MRSISIFLLAIFMFINSYDGLSAQSNSSIVQEIQGILKSGQCLDVSLTGQTVRTRNTGGLYAYSFHGQSEFSGYRNTTGKMRAGFNIHFSDRQWLQGDKDTQMLEVNLNGSQVSVNIELRDWNSEFQLSNVKVSKERYGYFITGERTNGNSTTYYIISIYNAHTCLI